MSLLSPEDEKISKRLRWFGIDREGKQNGTWENDISELGYKYQLTDIAARMGIAGLADLDSVLHCRRSLFARYEKNLSGSEGLRLLAVPDQMKSSYNHAAWLATVVVDEGRSRVRDALRSNGIESNAVHFRNDQYSTFGAFGRADAPTMDFLEDRYLCLPLHTNMDVADVDRVCEVLLGAL